MREPALLPIAEWSIPGIGAVSALSPPVEPGLGCAPRFPAFAPAFVDGAFVAFPSSFSFRSVLNPCFMPRATLQTLTGKPTAKPAIHTLQHTLQNSGHPVHMTLIPPPINTATQTR